MDPKRDSPFSPETSDQLAEAVGTLLGSVLGALLILLISAILLPLIEVIEPLPAIAVAFSVACVCWILGRYIRR